MAWERVEVTATLRRGDALVPALLSWRKKVGGCVLLILLSPGIPRCTLTPLSHTLNGLRARERAVYSFQDGAEHGHQVPRAIGEVAKVLKILLGSIMAVRKLFQGSSGHGCCKCSQVLSHLHVPSGTRAPKSKPLCSRSDGTGAKIYAGDLWAHTFPELPSAAVSHL